MAFLAWPYCFGRVLPHFRGPFLAHHIWKWSSATYWSPQFPRGSAGKESAKMQETPVHSWVGKIPWRRDRLPTPVFLGFPGGSAGEESACNVGDLGLIPELGRPPGEGNSRLPTPVFWPGEFHGLHSPWVTKSQKQLSDIHLHSLEGCNDPLEKRKVFPCRVNSGLSSTIIGPHLTCPSCGPLQRGQRLDSQPGRHSLASSRGPAQEAHRCILVRLFRADRDRVLL